MKITPELTDPAILQALGQRLERQRIEADLTQAALAKEAGVSKRTVERIEAGNGCELVVFIRVLRVLKLIDGFDILLPEVPPSPITLLKLKGKERRRVRRGDVASASSASTTSVPTKPSARRKPWKWEQ